MTKDHTVALRIEYEGTNYHGWQRQATQITVQQVIEEKIAQIVGQFCPLYGACRTDAGAHALAQVAHVTIPRNRTGAILFRGLNSLLPKDISITEVCNVPNSFHARYDARAKRYCYRIWNHGVEHPFLRRFALWIPYQLNCRTMSENLSKLKGTHDFSSFRAASCSAKSAVRTLFRASFSRSGSLLLITLEGNGFLQYMVRIIVGTLLEIGAGKCSTDTMEILLQKCDRTQAGFTASAHGLVLEEVFYDQVTFQEKPRPFLTDYEFDNF